MESAFISVDFCYFAQPFCHKKFQGYMFICRNAEGVHGQRKVGNPWSRKRLIVSSSIARIRSSNGRAVSTRVSLL